MFENAKSKANKRPRTDHLKMLAQFAVASGCVDQGSEIKTYLQRDDENNHNGGLSGVAMLGT